MFKGDWHNRVHDPPMRAHKVARWGSHGRAQHINTDCEAILKFIVQNMGKRDKRNPNRN